MLKNVFYKAVTHQRYLPHFIAQRVTSVSISVNEVAYVLQVLAC